MTGIAISELTLWDLPPRIFASEGKLLALVKAYSQQRSHSIVHGGLDAVQELTNNWVSYAVAAGIGQYSARTGTSLVVLGEVLAHLSYATGDELTVDEIYLGEQIEDTYCQPTKVREASIPTRVFPASGFPDDLGDLLVELEDIHPEGEDIVSQAYHVFFAENGRLAALSFRTPDEYNPANAIPLGKTTFEGVRPQRLVFTAEGDRRSDFTEALVKY